jgi:predicted secreted protein
MSNTILVSTRKGLFTVNRGRGGWAVSNGDFVGDNVTLTLHDPRDGTDYAALNHGHFGILAQVIRQSRKGSMTLMAGASR